MEALTQREMSAIITLLHDRGDADIVQMVQAQLQQLDLPMLEDLRRRAVHASDEAVMEIETALQGKRWDELAGELTRLCRTVDPPLLELLILLARFGHVDCADESIRGQFAMLAEQCRQTFTDNDTLVAKADKIAAVLGQRLGFTGNDEDYYRPENSYIDWVLRHRTGIPISLSCVYLVVGELLGIPLRGVALPGHFIIGLFVWNGKAIYYDPYGEGRRLSKLDCAQRLSERGHRFDERVFAPVTSRQIVQRMLNNLYHAYDLRKDQHRLAGVVRLVRAIG